MDEYVSVSSKYVLTFKNKIIYKVKYVLDLRNNVGKKKVMDQNEVSIHLHAHNYANLQETEKLHLENKTTFNLEYIDFKRVKRWFNFSEIFQNFSNMSFCM